MKKLMLWWLIIAAAIGTARAQSRVEDRRLNICYNKTTSLIFPFSITSVDRGSKDLLAQKSPGVENVLQIKAGRKDFPETNLTVITADGMLYHFVIAYADAPAQQTMNVAMVTGDPSLILNEDATNERVINLDSRNVFRHPIQGKVTRRTEHQLSLALLDISVRENVLYCRLSIQNNSAINFDIKSLKFIVADKKKVKRTSSQEEELGPIHIHNETKTIKGFESATIVYSVKKFTIPDGKILRINLFEENGGRHLGLKIKNKDILKARMLPIEFSVLTNN